MEGLISIFLEIIHGFVEAVYYIFGSLFPPELVDNLSFNIYLFSDTGWFNQPIHIADLFALIMGIFIFIFLLRLLYKGTKKFINMIFGVIKL